MADCKRCGKCCSYIQLPLGIDTDDYYHWLKLHGAKIVDWRGMSCARFEIPCRMLHGDTCLIYEQRPEMCRTWACEDGRP